jgi:uncharacterized protein (DUF362 family)
MKKITRRHFVKNSIALSGTAFISLQVPGILKAAIPLDLPDIVTIPADDPMMRIPLLLEPLGGIGSFVKNGNTVGILVNSPWVNPGTYTHPDVALSVAKLCKDAGAKQIVCFKPVREGYWEESRYYEDLKSLINEITYGDERVEVDIPGGLELKKAEIFKAFLDVDVYISIPVAKHHSGTNFSGNLKGLMGVSTSATNRHMHSPDGEYTYEKHEYLSQCIADLNLIRQPDLCIVDAMECVLNNGPRGPGQTVKPNLILAGIDPVALDAWSVNLLEFDVYDVPTIEKAANHGLGQFDLSKLNVLEL